MEDHVVRRRMQKNKTKQIIIRTQADRQASFQIAIYCKRAEAAASLSARYPNSEAKPKRKRKRKEKKIE